MKHRGFPLFCNWVSPHPPTLQGSLAIWRHEITSSPKNEKPSWYHNCFPSVATWDLFIVRPRRRGFPTPIPQTRPQVSFITFKFPRLAPFEWISEHIIRFPNVKFSVRCWCFGLLPQINVIFWDLITWNWLTWLRWKGGNFDFENKRLDITFSYVGRPVEYSPM